MEIQILNIWWFQFGQNDVACFRYSLSPGLSCSLLLVVRKCKGKSPRDHSVQLYERRAKKGGQENRNIPKLFSLQLKFS